MPSLPGVRAFREVGPATFISKMHVVLSVMHARQRLLCRQLAMCSSRRACPVQSHEVAFLPVAQGLFEDSGLSGLDMSCPKSSASIRVGRMCSSHLRRVAGLDRSRARLQIDRTTLFWGLLCIIVLAP